MRPLQLQTGQGLTGKSDVLKLLIKLVDINIHKKPKNYIGS